MPRRTYQSFHYERDVQRVAQVRQMGVIEGQRLLSTNGWEDVRRRGSWGIRRWIAREMQGKSCVVVLIGSQTAGRKWVEYEIKRGWGEGRGLVGVHIHNLRDLAGAQSAKGANPFHGLTVKASGEELSTVVRAYDPPHTDSRLVYRHIAANLAGWVEEAIRIRRRYPR